MDGELEALSDTATNCNLPSATETISDFNQAKLDTLEKKAVHLRLVLEKDFKAADIKWSLFVAAAFSFRYESCLRPFPPSFLKNGIKDMDTLHDSIITTGRSSAATPRPQYIFQVNSSCKSTTENKWKELAKNHHTFFAYHGNRLENFYTILNFGLHQHLNKNTLLGNGVYLSPELNTSLPFSHGGFGWGASCIGGHLSCVAMCEIIDAPEGINYQKPVSNEGDGIYEDQKNKSIEQGANGTSTTQYIVTNCDLVRLRYLLIYAKQTASMRFPTTNSNRNVGGLRHWLSRHKLFSILLGYGLMLATIGFANNQPIHYYYKILLKKLDFAYSNVKI
ncbi:protein mono-ADP-ribosyltransferase PARP16 isoform X2 [Galleria mellonella]|uniref:Protein mono-ADP-ribosyltransferase PARP16 isoform X2 n=1 Tax=Galleria mellonella TaxID=7137 RepID=A0A6J3CDM2_GALME|nr:protein mono-ADP-ribosyltransferase PARP16 isoform X2 [Galleria mellonella]